VDNRNGRGRRGSITACSVSRLEETLDEHHKHLIHRRLAKEAYRPYLVGWVRRFLQFANDKTGHKFEAPARQSGAIFESIVRGV